MVRLPYEAFLALRYLRPRRTFVSVITVISILGVMLGVGVLIIVIAVMSGFDQEWRSRILGFNAHIKITEQSGMVGDYDRVIQTVASNKHVKGVAPFVRAQVMVKTQPDSGNPKISAPLLKGIDPEAEKSVSVLPTSVVSGEFDLSGNGILVGRDFAYGMGLQVGDRIAVYSPRNLERMEQTRGTGRDEAVLPDEFEVRGIFDVGFAEYNASIIVTSLQNGQDLYNLGDNHVHGIQIMLDDPFNCDLVRNELRGDFARTEALLKREEPIIYDILTWPEENPQLFGALKVEKNMMFFLLFFIMIVAAFGIVNCQITFVVQKTREIGILKALGSTRTQILMLFLSQSFVVGFLGVGFGLLMGLTSLAWRNEFLSTMNRLTGMELLPAAIYQIYELPASIEPLDIAIICGTAFITCVLAGLFPAWKASRLHPIEALRYE